MQSGFCFVTFSDHSAPVTAVAFLPSGSVVVSASLDGTVRAFDLVRYRNFRTMTSPHPVQFVSLAVDPAGEVQPHPTIPSPPSPCIVRSNAPSHLTGRSPLRRGSPTLPHIWSPSPPPLPPLTLLGVPSSCSCNSAHLLRLTLCSKQMHRT